jgi:hypothetical protein
MLHLSQRVLAVALFATGLLTAATLEKLSVEDMARKSTAIVRARVTSCDGEQQGSQILTRCRVQVLDTWKGSLPQNNFVLPGGRSGGLVQTYSGTPRVTEGQEYVVFLWTGRSGNAQVIGLSQGLFGLAVDSKGEPRARRGASTEQMLDKDGNPVTDSAFDFSVSELKLRVQKVLQEGVR